MKTCLVIGSINMDYTIYVESFPLEGETIYGDYRYVQPGGKGENQAVALANSNKVKTIMVGCIGDDKDGEVIKDVLNHYNIENKLVIDKGGITGNATIVVSKDSENKIMIIAGANNKLKITDIDIKLIEEADYIILQNEIPETINDYVIEIASRLNKVIVYNPAPFRKISEKSLSKIDYFIPNECELKKYSKCDNMEEGIKELLNKGVKNVLVTLGTRGSLLVNKEERIHVDAIKVKAVDTVAAGDTFVGYFVASLASGMDKKEAMEKASLASSITVSRFGSVISIPKGNEVYEN